MPRLKKALKTGPGPAWAQHVCTHPSLPTHAHPTALAYREHPQRHFSTAAFRGLHAAHTTEPNSVVSYVMQVIHIAIVFVVRM